MQGGVFWSWAHLGTHPKQNATQGHLMLLRPRVFPTRPRAHNGEELAAFRRAVAVCGVPVAVARSVVSCRGFRKVRKRAVLFVGKMKMWVPTWGS